MAVRSFCFALFARRKNNLKAFSTYNGHWRATMMILCMVVWSIIQAQNKLLLLLLIKYTTCCIFTHSLFFTSITTFGSINLDVSFRGALASKRVCYQKKHLFISKYVV